MKKNTVSFRIDTRWCLDELLKDQRISQRDANLVATTARTRDKIHWHPLQIIAEFDFLDPSKPNAKLSIDALTTWLADKANIHFLISYDLDDTTMTPELIDSATINYPCRVSWKKIHFEKTYIPLFPLKELDHPFLLHIADQSP